MDTSFKIDLSASYTLIAMYSMLHIAACIIIWVLPIYVLVKLPLTIIVLTGLCHSLKHAMRKAPRSISRIEHKPQAPYWWVDTTSAKQIEVKVLADTVVSAICISLHVKAAGKAYSGLIFCWELKPEVYRQLARTLRIHASF